MKIAIGQVDCTLGEPAANLRMIQQRIQEAASAGCRLIILPEMSDTGYDMEVIKAHARPWSDGPCRQIGRWAAESQVAVICGLAERDGSQFFNSAAVIDETGTQLGKYRKTHLFSLPPVCEDQHLGRGDALAIVRIAGFTIGVLICYDLRFPEIARVAALRGAEILVVVAAWPASRIEAWNTLAVARAMENQVYVAASNRVGVDGRMVFGGNSRLLDPLGVSIAQAGDSQPTLLIGAIDRDCIERTRGTMRVFDDRRPELYGDLVHSSRG